MSVDSRIDDGLIYKRIKYWSTENIEMHEHIVHRGNIMRGRDSEAMDRMLNKKTRRRQGHTDKRVYNGMDDRIPWPFLPSCSQNS